MTQNKAKPDEIDFDSQNIFDEFSDTQNIEEEIQKIEEKQVRDSFYYLKKINSFVLGINIIAMIAIMMAFYYIYIQTSEEKKEYAFLQPVCQIFLGDAGASQNTCYGINPILKEQKMLLQQEKERQVKEILPLLGEVYSIENFSLSRKVSFLLEKTESRIRPLEILTAFDSIKNSFAPTDKSELSCHDIKISAGNILEITCDAYSSDWDTKIITYSNGGISYIKGGGTSISRASSFLSFIEAVPNSPFIILEKPNILDFERVGLGPYTQKTTIQLRLQYNSIDTLTL